MSREFKDLLNTRYAVYGGYDKLTAMLDEGVPYRMIGQHFGNVDEKTIRRWKLQLNKRIDGIYK